MKSLTTLTTLFEFTTVKMKSLTSLTTLFYFTTIKMKFLTTLTTLFQFTTVKMRSLTTLTTLFYFTTIQMKSLTTLTRLFKFTAINPRDRTTITTLPLSIKYFSSQEFQCVHKICVCHSNFTVRMFIGVLHALLPIFVSLVTKKENEIKLISCKFILLFYCFNSPYCFVMKFLIC